MATQNPSQTLIQDACTAIQFKDPEFLQFYNGVPAARALDYIALSQHFYDPSCINEQVKMQTRYASMDSAELDYSKMTGVQYELTWSRDPLIHHITKSYKHPSKPGETSGAATPMARYYIYLGCIYQAPDLHALLCSRLRSSLYHLDKAFHAITQQATFHPAQDYVWNDPTATKYMLGMINAPDNNTTNKDQAENGEFTYDPVEELRYRQAVDKLIQQDAQQQHVEIIKPHGKSVPDQDERTSSAKDIATSYAESTGTGTGTLTRRRRRKQRMPSADTVSVSSMGTGETGNLGAFSKPADEELFINDTASMGDRSSVGSVASGFGLKRKKKKSLRDKERTMTH